MNNPTTTPFLRVSMVLCLVVIVATFVLGWQNEGLLKEGGALELTTVVTLVLVTFLLVFTVSSGNLKTHWHLPALTAFLAMRELDFDKRFMETGVLKLRLYTGDAPFQTKLVGAVVICAILICLYRLLRHDGRPFLMALRRRENSAITLATAVLCVVVAKSIDGLNRKLAPYGLSVTNAQEKFTEYSEESLEFVFAAGLLLSLFFWLSRQNRIPEH